MNLNFTVNRDKLWVQVAGDVDLSAAPRFRTELDKNLDQSKLRHLVLDFSQVTFIDSSGLGVILGRYKRLTEIGGDITVVGVNAQIGKILELSGLSRIMEIKRDDDSQCQDRI